MGRRSLALAVMAVALALIGLGHYYLLFRRLYYRDAFVFYAVAALFLIITYRRAVSSRAEAWPRAGAALRRFWAAVAVGLIREPGLLALLLLALNVASFLLLVGTPSSPPLSVVVLVALLWAASGALLGSLARRVDRAAGFSRRLRQSMERWPAILYTLLCVGVLSAILGQVFFFYQPERVERGLVCWGVAILAFAALLWLESPSVVRPKATAATPRLAEPDGVVGLPAVDRRRSLSALPGGRSVWGPLVSLPVAILAQAAIQFLPLPYKWAGAVGYGIALALFWSGLRGPVFSPRWTGRFPWRLLGALTAAGLVAAATYQAHVRPPAAHSYGQALVLWAAGILLAAAVLGEPWRWRWPRWRSGLREAILVAGVFLIAFLLRTIGLARFPDVMSGDEGSMALEAQRILLGDLTNPFGTGWLAHHNLFFYLEAGALRLWGWNLFGLRFTAAFLGALGVAAVYLLGRWMWGPRTAWIGAAFAAGWGLPLHFSRLALNNSADLLFGALTLAFLQRGLSRGGRGFFVAAGLSLGLGLYFYYGTRLLFFVVIATLLLAGRARLRRHWEGVLTFVFVALLVFGPLMVYLLQHPDQLFPRGAEIGLFASGQLEAERQWTGRSTLMVALVHLARAAGAFICTPDQGYFYRPTTAILDVFSGALFVLGVGLACGRWRDGRYALLLVWIGLTIVFGGFLLVSPPHYQRYLIAAPAVCLLVGRAAETLLRRAARFWRWSPAAWRGAAAALGFLLLAINAGYYFGVYAPRGAFIWDRNTLIADRAARLMVEAGPEYTTYFFGTSHMPLGAFNSVRFLAPEADWMDILNNMPSDWGFVKRDRRALFIVIPERMDDLPLLRERFPGGVEEYVYARDGALLFAVYWVESPA